MLMMIFMTCALAVVWKSYDTDLWFYNKVSIYEPLESKHAASILRCGVLCVSGLTLLTFTFKHACVFFKQYFASYSVRIFFFSLTPFLSRLVSICWLIIESKLKLKEIFTITSVSLHVLQRYTSSVLFFINIT